MPFTGTARDLITLLSQVDDLDKPIRNKDGSPLLGIHECLDNPFPSPNNCILIYFACDKD